MSSCRTPAENGARMLLEAWLMDGAVNNWHTSMRPDAYAALVGRLAPVFDARDYSAAERVRQTERAEAAERQRDELAARLEWVATALHESTTSLSDFALSFPEVRAAWDCREERRQLRERVVVLTGRLQTLRRNARKAGKR